MKKFILAVVILLCCLVVVSSGLFIYNEGKEKEMTLSHKLDSVKTIAKLREVNISDSINKQSSYRLDSMRKADSLKLNRYVSISNNAVKAKNKAESDLEQFKNDSNNLDKCKTTLADYISYSNSLSVQLDTLSELYDSKVIQADSLLAMYTREKRSSDTLKSIIQNKDKLLRNDLEIMRCRNKWDNNHKFLVWLFKMKCK